MKCAVFASGNGSNFQALLEAFQGNTEIDISFLFSDNPEAYALKRAEKNKIKTYQKSPNDFETHEKFEEYLVDICTSHKIDYILLAGYMRIIGASLLEAFPMKIINIHPSLLPDFPGKNGIEDAYKAGVKQTGVTIHFIDSGIDTGPIIKQEIVNIAKNDSLKDLKEKIHAVEHQLYPKIVRKILREEII